MRAAKRFTEGAGDWKKAYSIQFEVELARRVVALAVRDALQDDMEAIQFLTSPSLAHRVMREHWFAQAMLPGPDSEFLARQLTELKKSPHRMSLERLTRIEEEETHKQPV